MEILVWVLVILIQPGTVATTSVTVDNLASEAACAKAGQTIARLLLPRGTDTDIKIACVSTTKVLASPGVQSIAK